MDSVHVLERVLRELIESVLRAQYGERWITHVGVTPDRLQRWRGRLVEEEKQRAGLVVDKRLLSYSDFTDLLTILKKNWEYFKPCFGDLKRLEVYLDRLSNLRNPNPTPGYCTIMSHV